MDAERAEIIGQLPARRIDDTSFGKTCDDTALEMWPSAREPDTACILPDGEIDTRIANIIKSPGAESIAKRTRLGRARKVDHAVRCKDADEKTERSRDRFDEPAIRSSVPSRSTTSGGVGNARATATDCCIYNPGFCRRLGRPEAHCGGVGFTIR